MSSEDDDGVVAASEAAAVNQEAVLTTMNAPVGAAALLSAAITLEPLVEIFHDTEHFRTFYDNDEKPRWQCLWCTEDYGGHNATKCLHHAARIRGKGIKICSGDIPDNHYKRYYNLYEQKMGAKSKKNGKCCFLF